MSGPNLLEIVDVLSKNSLNSRPAISGYFRGTRFDLPCLRGDRGPLDRLAAETLAEVVTRHCSSDAGNQERVLDGLRAVGLLTAWMETRSQQVNNRCSECDAQM